MPIKKAHILLPIVFILCTWPSYGQNSAITVADAIKLLDRNTGWQLVSEIDIAFDTYHPQGFALVGDNLFISSVEIIERTKRFEEPVHGLDRTPGQGVGHVFKTDRQGNLLAQVEIGKHEIYHPGGIDFDGTHLWIPVAEYRPDSKSIIYSMHPDSLIPIERFHVQDHIGGIIADTKNATLHAISWGSRRYYSWPSNYAPLNQENPLVGTLNPSHYIDYQDCQYTGNHTAICTGLSGYHQPASQAHFALGGIELIDLFLQRPIHQVPFPFWTESGLPMTQNPVVLELEGSVLRLYAMPEDNKSRLFIFETDLAD